MTLQPGLAALLLAGLGGAIVLRRGGRGAPFLAAGGIFLWLSFGPHAPIDGFRLLHPLPLFESMRGPLRYLNFPVLVSLILLAGLGFDALFAGRRFQTQAWGLGAALVLGLPTAIDTQSLYETAFLYRPPQVEATESPQSEGLRSRSLGGADHINLRKYVNTQRGTPTIYVPEDVPVEVAARPVGWLTIDGGLAPEPQYRGEAWVVEPDGNPQAAGKPPGTAELVAYRAQEIEVAVHLEREGLVLLNQNAWPGWECDDLPASQVAARSQGLVGFVAPSGPKRTVLCRWTAPWWRQGLIGSLSGLLVLGLLWPWPKGKKASGAL